MKLISEEQIKSLKGYIVSLNQDAFGAVAMLNSLPDVKHPQPEQKKEPAHPPEEPDQKAQ